MADTAYIIVRAPQFKTVDTRHAAFLRNNSAEKGIGQAPIPIATGNDGANQGAILHIG